MKIAVYGTGFYSETFLKRLKFAVRKVEIVYFVESQKTKDSYNGLPVVEAKCINPNEFDYLVIAIRSYGEIYDYMRKNLPLFEKIEPKVIRMSYFLHMITGNLGGIYPYSSVKLTCGLNYIFSSEDCFIGQSMTDVDDNYARDSIEKFFYLTDKYYGKRERKGVFFDIGANIGTTSIYVNKIVNPGLRVIGIEAGAENYNLFRVNCIINNAENIRPEHMGFGNRNEHLTYHYVPENPGGSTIRGTGEIEGEEDVYVMTMDDYCSENNISNEDIDYIWMDTEGFEAQIIEGAQSVLSGRSIPLIQEFNPSDYRHRGLFDDYCSLMSQLYTGFIDVGKYNSENEKIISTSEIGEYAMQIEEENFKTDLFFIG